MVVLCAADVWVGDSEADAATFVRGLLRVDSLDAVCVDGACGRGMPLPVGDALGVILSTCRDVSWDLAWRVDLRPCRSLILIVVGVPTRRMGAMSFGEVDVLRGVARCCGAGCVGPEFFAVWSLSPPSTMLARSVDPSRC